MTNNGIRIILIFFQEVIGTGESYLIDVFINFFGSQTNTAIGDGNCILIKRYMNGQIT